MTIKSDNERIAKNTVILYTRMAVMMLISFFTARITLNALGVVDYGINNVVGGLVSMFSLLSNSLSCATGRFLTFGLGENNIERLKAIFRMSINIQAVLSVIIVLAIESLGVWFLNNKMTIPSERLVAANWVLQCSVVLFAVGLFSVPFNALIIAHEKMSAFAYMTIFDASAKLIIICSICYYGGDKLILLALLSMGLSLIRQLIYCIYCKVNFEECSYKFIWNKKLGKEMFGFATWNFIGSTAGLMKDQGVNIAINLFTGPAINAARGIAMQVNGIIGQFIGGFSVALDPQITKNYASKDYKRMFFLIFQGARLSYFLFMFLSIPIMFEIETILWIWLGQVPEHTVLFTRLVLILTLAEIVSGTLITAQNATGNIRNYQIVVGGILLLNFPISYFLLKKGFFPESTVIVAIVISQICLVARLWFLRTMIGLSARAFIKKVYLNVLSVTVVAIIPPALCFILLDEAWYRLIILSGISAITSFASIYYIGCDSREKIIIKTYIRNKLSKFKTRSI